MIEHESKTRITLAGAVVAGLTASLCCILPLIAALAGFTGFAASEFFASWRPYLLAVTFGLLAIGFYLAYRPPRRETCEAGSACARTPIGRWNRAVLWVVALFVIALAAFPHYSGWVARAVTKARQSPEVAARGPQAHAVLEIDGMTCSSCAALLEKKLSQIAGVRRVEVSLEKKQATVDYDPRAVDPSQFVKSVTDAGYKAASPAKAGN